MRLASRLGTAQPQSRSAEQPPGSVLGTERTGQWAASQYQQRQDHGHSPSQDSDKSASGWWVPQIHVHPGSQALFGSRVFADNAKLR